MADEADGKGQADARLTQALLARGQADPRASYRERLRQLRAQQSGLFDAATRHYSEVVLPSLVDVAADPIETWVDYGRFLAELEGPGRVVRIDESGRAEGATSADGSSTMLIFLPEDRHQRALALLTPAQPSAAQKASYDLLVGGRLSL